MSRHVPVPTLQLAPGVRVVARGRDRLQVGLYDEHRVVLPRTEEVQRLLDVVVEGGPAPTTPPEAAVALDRLLRAGLVVSREAVVEARRERERTRVQLLCAAPEGLGEAHPGPLAAQLLRGAGLHQARGREAASVVLVLTVGEVRRELLDPLVRTDTDHLVVRLVDGGALLGPFVAPGRTACVRCIDAHRSIADPGHVAVTTRYVTATSRRRPDAVPDTPDPALTTLALAWAARDLAAYAEGRAPGTWSRTIALGPSATPAERLWAMHPQCGCSLSGDLGLSGTMGA